MSWADDLVAEMLLILKKTIFLDMIVPRFCMGSICGSATGSIYSGLRGNPPDQPVPTAIKGGSYWCNYVVTLSMPSDLVSICRLYCGML